MLDTRRRNPRPKLRTLRGDIGRVPVVEDVIAFFEGVGGTVQPMKIDTNDIEESMRARLVAVTGAVVSEEAAQAT